MLLLKTYLKASTKNSDFGIAVVKKRRPETQDDFCRERPAEKTMNLRVGDRTAFLRETSWYIHQKKKKAPTVTSNAFKSCRVANLRYPADANGLLRGSCEAHGSPHFHA